MKVVIIGAGVMGLSTAWRLAKAGASVEVLDSRAPGKGATLAALGALWPASPLVKGPLQALHRRSLGEFEGFARMVGEASGRAVSYRRNGRIEILNSAKALARAHQEAAASGGVLEVVDSAGAKALNPGIAAFAHGALRCRATAQVSVQELVAGLVRACELAGVQRHEVTPITTLVHEGERIMAVETAGGAVRADVFLVASGAWTPLISPLLTESAPIVPAKGQGIALAMPAGRPLTTIIKSGPIYLIPWDKEILVGSTTEPEAGFDESVTEQAREKLLAGAAAIVPELRGAAVLRHWAGLRPKSRVKPHDPVMGRHPVFGNLYLCAGHYKTGVGLSPAVSALMAEAVLEGKVPAELAPFVPRVRG